MIVDYGVDKYLMHKCIRCTLVPISLYMYVIYCASESHLKLTFPFTLMISII